MPIGLLPALECDNPTRILTVGERQTTSRFEGLQRRAAVVTRAGENDSYGALSVCLSERKQEKANRDRPAVRLSWWLQGKLLILYRHFRVWRHEVNVIWFKEHAFLYFDHSHSCDTAQNLRQQIRIL